MENLFLLTWHKARAFIAVILAVFAVYYLGGIYSWTQDLYQAHLLPKPTQVKKQDTTKPDEWGTACVEKEDGTEIALIKYKYFPYVAPFETSEMVVVARCGKCEQQEGQQLKRQCVPFRLSLEYVVPLGNEKTFSKENKKSSFEENREPNLLINWGCIFKNAGVGESECVSGGAMDFNFSTSTREVKLQKYKAVGGASGYARFTFNCVFLPPERQGEKQKKEQSKKCTVIMKAPSSSIILTYAPAKVFLWQSIVHRLLVPPWANLVLAVFAFLGLLWLEHWWCSVDDENLTPAERQWMTIQRGIRKGYNFTLILIRPPAVAIERLAIERLENCTKCAVIKKWGKIIWGAGRWMVRVVSGILFWVVRVLFKPCGEEESYDKSHFHEHLGLLSFIVRHIAEEEARRAEEPQATSCMEQASPAVITMRWKEKAGWHKPQGNKSAQERLWIDTLLAMGDTQRHEWFILPAVVPRELRDFAEQGKALEEGLNKPEIIRKLQESLLQEPPNRWPAWLAFMAWEREEFMELMAGMLKQFATRKKTLLKKRGVLLKKLLTSLAQESRDKYEVASRSANKEVGEVNEKIKAIFDFVVEDSILRQVLEWIASRQVEGAEEGALLWLIGKGRPLQRVVGRVEERDAEKLVVKSDNVVRSFVVSSKTRFVKVKNVEEILPGERIVVLYETPEQGGVDIIAYVVGPVKKRKARSRRNL